MAAGGRKKSPVAVIACTGLVILALCVCDSGAQGVSSEPTTTPFMEVDAAGDLHIVVPSGKRVWLSTANGTKEVAVDTLTTASQVSATCAETVNQAATPLAAALMGAQTRIATLETKQTSTDTRLNNNEAKGATTDGAVAALRADVNALLQANTRLLDMVSRLNSTLTDSLARIAVLNTALNTTRACAAQGLLPPLDATATCGPPAARVSVQASAAAACDSAALAGALRRRDASSDVEVCDGSRWTSVAVGTSAAGAATQTNLTALQSSVSVLQSNVTRIAGDVVAITPPPDTSFRTLAIADYRIYQATAAGGPTAAKLRTEIRPSSGLNTSLSAHMCSENVRGSAERGFINTGNFAAWALRAPANTQVVLQGMDNFQDDGQTVNDVNGKPDFILANVGNVIVNSTVTTSPSTGCDVSGGICFIPNGNVQDTNQPAFQTIKLTGEAGRFVVIAPYRLKAHVRAAYFVRSFLTCDNCVNMGNGNAVISNARMLAENVDFRGGQLTRANQ